MTAAPVCAGSVRVRIAPVSADIICSGRVTRSKKRATARKASFVVTVGE